MSRTGSRSGPAVVSWVQLTSPAGSGANVYRLRSTRAFPKHSQVSRPHVVLVVPHRGSRPAAPSLTLHFTAPASFNGHAWLDESVRMLERDYAPKARSVIADLAEFARVNVDPNALEIRAVREGGQARDRPRTKRVKPPIEERRFQSRGVLAGAYRGFLRRGESPAMASSRTHWLEMCAGRWADKTLCRKIAEGRLADEYADEEYAPVTCPDCIARLERAEAKGPVKILGRTD